MIQRTRRATLAGLLVALIVAAGYSLAGVPNVELVTLLVFVSGFLLGPRLGLAVGATSWGLYSLLNPMGAAVPPVLAVRSQSSSSITACTNSLVTRTELFEFWPATVAYASPLKSEE